MRPVFSVYLVDGADGRGVVVEIVAVDSEFGAESHKHVSHTLIGPPLLQPRPQIGPKPPATHKQTNTVRDAHKQTRRRMCAYVPVELQNS